MEVARILQEVGRMHLENLELKEKLQEVAANKPKEEPDGSGE